MLTRLRAAVSAAPAEPSSTLWAPIAHLQKGDELALTIARQLLDASERELGRLFYPVRHKAVDEVQVPSCARFTVFNLKGLVKPDESVELADYTPEELLYRPIMSLAAWTSLQLIYRGDPHERKFFGLDEAQEVTEVSGAGRTLVHKLRTDSRKNNNAVFLVSQHARVVADAANFIGAVFVGRTQSEDAQAAALKLLGKPPGRGYEQLLGSLSARPRRDAEALAYREFVYRDGLGGESGHGGMEKIRVSMAHHPDLFAALDTTPRPAQPSHPGRPWPHPGRGQPGHPRRAGAGRGRRAGPGRCGMTRRVTAAVLLAVAALLGFAATASAAAGSPPRRPVVVVPGIGPDCKGNPPLPASPSGPLGLRPAVTSTADPFTTPGVSIASVYGTNYRWWWYDNGCGAGSDIMPSLVTNIANVIGLQFPGLLLSIGQGLFTAVIDPSGWIGFLDKPIEQATASVAAGVWFPFLSLALLLVAVVTLLRAARGQLSGTITATVWALTILVLVTWTVGYPTESVKMLDSGIQTAVVTTAQGFSPQAGQQASSNTDPQQEGSARAAAVAAMDAQWDTINRSTVYRSWLQGVFGQADSPTAAKFGPTVFRATHFSWSEYDTYQRDPTGAGKQLVDRKAAEFRRVAEQLSTADPVAYQFFTGNMTGDRLGTAVLCLFITVIVTMFFIAAGLLTVLGYAVARLIVPVTPAAGVFFLLDSFRDLALSWGQRIVRFLVMGPIAFLASLVLFAFTSAIFAAAMPDGLKYLFITALSWLAWRLMRPHTAFGRMHVPGKKLLGQVLATKLAVPATPSKRSNSSGDDDQDADGQMSTASAAAAGDRLVYTRRRPPIASPRFADADDEQVLYYTAAPAAAHEDPRPLGTAETNATRTRSGIAAGHVQARSVRLRSGELGLYQPAHHPIRGRGRAACCHAAATCRFTSWRRNGRHRARVAAVPTGQDQLRPALPPGQGVLEGRPLQDGEQLPGNVHESNLTVDKDGNRVFEVYRPQGSRFYAQDE